MAEQYVQVPVSLIGDALDAIRSGHDPSLWPDVVQALEAILSQPTPTAWTQGDSGPDAFGGEGGSVEPVPATPPSIADMVPGTTFTAQVREFTNPVDWEVLPYVGGGVFARSPSSWRWCTQADIDPSTIRDVAPPTA